MQIACPACQKQLRVPDTAAGKTVKCPACGKAFQAFEIVEEKIQTAPAKPAPKAPPPAREEIEEAPRRRRDRDDEDDDRGRRRVRDDDDDRDDDRPRRRRDRDDDYDDDAPRSRRSRDYDDDDGDYKSDKREARSRAGAASIWFLLAGIISLIIVAYGVISALVLNVNVGPVGNQAAFQAGRIAGIIGCGAIGTIGAVCHFMASSGLKSFRNKGMVITAIVFGFIFGLLFAIVAILSMTALATAGRFLGGGFMVLLVVEMILRSAGAFVNLFAAIKGITTLNNRAVSRQFNRG
jgi:predicted Zn finger-like uncharacterized protein